MKRIFSITLFSALVGGSGFWAQAQPAGRGYEVDLGLMTIRPYAEATLGYDSNVFAQQEEESDAFGTLRFGLRQEKRVGIFEISADVFYFIERYQDLREADSEDIGFDLDLGANGGRELGNRRKIAYYIDADYNDSQELDYQTGEIEDSRVLSLGLGAGKTFGKTDFDLMYDYATKSYGDKSRTFNKSIRRTTIFDSDTHTFTGQLAHKVSAKTHALLIGAYHIQDSDGFSEDGTYYDVRAGVKHEATQKTTLEASVGFMDHEEGDISTVSFDVAANWKATSKLSFEVAGNNQIEPSAISPDNYVLSTRALVSGTWLATDRVAVSAGFEWQNYDTERPVVLRVNDDGVSQVLLTPQTFESDNYRTYMKVVYAVPKERINLFAEVDYDTRDSSVAENDFDRYIAHAGVILFY